MSIKTVNVEDIDKGGDVADIGWNDALNKLAKAEKPPLVTTALSIEKFRERLQEEGQFGSFGIPSLDKVCPPPTSGLVIIQGRTKHGKSTLMMNMALRKALQGDEVVYFSLEMNEVRSLVRMIMIEKDRRYGISDRENLEAYIESLTNDIHWGDPVVSLLRDKLWLVYTPPHIDYYMETLSKPEMRGKTVFLDYLQLLRPQDRGQGQLALESICNSLREVALANNILIITGAQVTVNRAQPSPMTDYVRGAADLDFVAELALRVWNMKVGDATENGTFATYNDYDFLVRVILNRNGDSGDVIPFTMPNLTLREDK